MRLMSLLSLFFGFLLCGLGMALGKDLSSLAVLVGIFVGAAFGGKVAQKFGESDGK